MTNLLTTISLLLTTNWHAVEGLDQEVQIVKKTHLATFVYPPCQTNQHVVKVEWEVLGLREKKSVSGSATNLFLTPNHNWWLPYSGENIRILTNHTLPYFSPP